MSIQLVAWALETPCGSSSRKAVLVALANCHNHHTGLCCPSLNRLATETELHKATVIRALVDLEKMGLIQKVERHRQNGSNTSNEYVFPPSRTVRPPLSQPATPPSRTVRPPEPEVEPEVEPKPSLVADATSGTVQRIYDHWRTARDKTRSSYDQISASRRQKIVSRLREFSEHELIAAIDAVASDPWPDRSRHDDLTVIFRSREQVDRFLEMAQNTSTPYERASGWLRTVGWEYDDEAIWHDLGNFGLADKERRSLAAQAQQIQAERTSVAI